MPLSLRKRNGIWRARGSVPERQADGTIGFRRIEQSARTGDRKRAIAFAAALERAAYQRAHHPAPKPETSFAEAAVTYMETTDVKRFVAPLLHHFRYTPLSEMDQDAVNGAARALYPGCSAATINRQVFTPVLAIINMAAEQGRCAKPCLKRPRGHDAVPQLSVPGEDWFDRVLPHCTPKLAALIVFLTLAGRRVTEATDLLPRDWDQKTGQVVIGRTKSGEPIVAAMPDLAAVYLRTKYRAQHRPSRKLFGFDNRGNVYRGLRKACAAAKVEYVPPHRFGRHAFATRLLANGRSLKHVMDAGGWATIKQPAMRYGHLERSEVAEDVRLLGQAWGAARISVVTKGGQR